jgi:Ulp1 family protease
MSFVFRRLLSDTVITVFIKYIRKYDKSDTFLHLT